MTMKIEKNNAYVEWDKTTTDIENFRRRVKAIVNNYECKANADITEAYNEIYPDARKDNPINKTLPSKQLSQIVNDKKHYMKKEDGAFYYIDNEDEKLFLEMVEVFNDGKGKSYTIKNYEIVIQKANVLYMMDLLMDKYPTKISNINIQYIKNYASIKITYRVLINAQDVEDDKLDVSTLNKLFKQVNSKVK